MKTKLQKYRIDNSGMLYPMMMTKNTQSLYRLNTDFASDIEPEILEKAVNSALARYPYYKTRLVMGFYRPYLIENTSPINVHKDDGFLKPIKFKKNSGYLFRILYNKNRLSLECFHALCDGSGAVEFLKTIVYYYLREVYGTEIKGVRTAETPILEGEYEDAFVKYFKKIELLKGTKTMAAGSALKPRGTLREESTGFGLTEIAISSQKLLNAAREKGCSITMFLTAVILLSVAEMYGDAQPLDAMGFIPVNLRKQFPSVTMNNFTIFVKCVVKKSVEKTFDSYLEIVKKEFETQLDKNDLESKLSFVSLMDKSLFKCFPLFVKKFLVRTGRFISKKSMQTMIFSNIGKIDAMENVTGFSLNMNCNKKTPVNFGLVSYADKTVIGLTSFLEGKEIQDRVLEHLTALGLSPQANVIF